ncbi:ECF RNA polymerase sigma factor SigE [Rubripirellula lacrimiformis]|uniref:ECF RNA polymerase sigma factor SigE n=1 Tax=Rubripirellula lacrimiformis TaxID=1930273 RepID=A0A517NDP7_9BACT|nr:sigma-70 family RNA polymerase sigma factor [Rubripirellula lacrimiformis]QDT05246.1 ECF RNA polymerase sigma factor SigE [Rubripirellula lacrimiformis]
MHRTRSDSPRMTSLPSEPITRASLLVRMQDAEDREAWEDFHSVYEPIIYNMARRRSMQDADAREIVQEVMLSVSRHLQRFDASAQGTFRGWLSRITRNATIDRMRHVSVRRETVDASGVRRRMDKIAQDHAATDRSLQEEFEQDRRRQLFHWAASEVRRSTGEKNWMAFWRSSMDGLPIAAVAKELEMDEAAVYVARCRIIKRIRQHVDQRWAE